MYDGVMSQHFVLGFIFIIITYVGFYLAYIFLFMAIQVF